MPYVIEATIHGRYNRTLVVRRDDCGQVSVGVMLGCDGSEEYEAVLHEGGVKDLQEVLDILGKEKEE